MSTEPITHAASTEAHFNTSRIECALTSSPLDSTAIINSVQHDSAGAIAVFIGTTRDSFEGKRVTRLEYQAYSKIAIKTITTIAEETLRLHSSSTHTPPRDPNAMATIIKCAIHHRLGAVPVGEPSIVIAVSSPHRREAFEACERILEDVKKRAQIWKREYYEGEGDDKAEWKKNS